MTDRPLTLAEVAERYRIKERKLREIVRTQGVAALKIGQDLRFDALALSSLDEAMRCPKRAENIKREAERSDVDIYFDARAAAKKADKLLSPTPKAMINKPGVFIYFISSGTSVKIGNSAYPEKRMAELQVGSSSPLELIFTMKGGRRTEKELHRRFASHRIRGEWFRKCNEIMEFVESKKQCRRRS